MDGKEKNMDNWTCLTENEMTQTHELPTRLENTLQELTERLDEGET